MVVQGAVLGVQGSTIPILRQTLSCRRVLPGLKRRSVRVRSGREIYGGSEHVESVDPYHVATVRLQELLQEARNRSDDLISAEVSHYPAEAKLTLCTNLGSLLFIAAFVICWLSGEDPLGGITLTESSLEAAVAGVWFSIPLLVFSWFCHSPTARKLFPVVEDLHSSQRDMLAPFITGLSTVQIGIILASITCPVLLVLLPAAKGSINSLMAVAYHTLLEPLAHLFHMSPDMSREMSFMGPVILSAYFAAWVIANFLSVRECEFSAIKEALRSSERYFRLTMSMDNRSSANESKRTSQAFRNVAVLWMCSRRQVAKLGYVLTALNVTYFGALWQYTGDLATPATAALLQWALELYYVDREVNKRD